MTIRHRLLCHAFLVIACSLALLFFTPAAAAQAKDWRIDGMDVLLDVQENGDVLVDETITFSFEGHYTYVGRLIPTGNMEGMNDIEVRTADGAALPQDDDNAPGTFSTFMEGSRRVIRYLWHVLGVTPAGEVLVPKVDARGDILGHDEARAAAEEIGRRLGRQRPAAARKGEE